MPEFTGERVLPGQVNADLWNEHFARYAFAARLARNRRVLEVACGAGYGSFELAQVARSVVGTDISTEAVEYAREHYTHPALRFEAASATGLPFEDGSFDLIVAFEVIEHLSDWRGLLSEARRLLAPGGQFVVSTPNRLYYEETRKQSGPNPFHAHEFAYDEFRQELNAFFPHVALFEQNHAEAIVIQPLGGVSASEVRAERPASDPGAAHFFIAVCAQSPQTGSPRYVYLPSTANVLREREHHIAKLEGELATKQEWLDQSIAVHLQLVRQHDLLKAELEQRNEWARKLNGDLDAVNQRVTALQDELAAEQNGARETVAAYEAKLAELDGELVKRTQWAQETEARLTAEVAARSQDLAKCVEALHAAEAELEKRTTWAQSLDSHNQQLTARVSAVAASRWYRLGRTLGLGPELRES